jgi:hypothetical protein
VDSTPPRDSGDIHVYEAGVLVLLLVLTASSPVEISSLISQQVDVFVTTSLSKHWVASCPPRSLMRPRPGQLLP